MLHKLHPQISWNFPTSVWQSICGQQGPGKPLYSHNDCFPCDDFISYKLLLQWQVARISVSVYFISKVGMQSRDVHEGTSSYTIDDHKYIIKFLVCKAIFMEGELAQTFYEILEQNLSPTVSLRPEQQVHPAKQDITKGLRASFLLSFLGVPTKAKAKETGQKQQLLTCFGEKDSDNSYLWGGRILHFQTTPLLMLLL